MISGQHRHKGGTGDGAKISYNDLIDKPAAAASTQFAQGQFNFSGTGSFNVTTGFTPKLIQFFCTGKISQGSNIESGCVSFGTVNCNTLAGTSTRLWHITNSTTAAGGGGPRAESSNGAPIVLTGYNSSGSSVNVVGYVTAISSTGFTVNIDTYGLSGSSWVQWTAFG